MKIGILGGSFDPPHAGHREVVEVAKETVDEVWIVPCGFRSDKHALSDSQMRLQMAKLAFPDCCVLDIEVSRGEMVPTYFLMKELASKHPEHQFYFILSTELLKKLHTWKEPQRLKEEVNFLVTCRPGFELTESEKSTFGSKGNFEFVQAQFKVVLSSTYVRQRISEAWERTSSKSQLFDLVSNWQFLEEAVLYFVIQHKLFKL